MNADFDLLELYQTLDRKRSDSDMSWAAVSNEIGVASSTIKGLANGRGVVEADGVLQMLLWLGRTPESFVPGDAMGEPLKEPGPQKILRWNTKALYSAIEQKRNLLGLTWKEIAMQIKGTSASSLTRLRKGGRTSITIVMRIADWLGQPANAFTHETARRVVPTRH